MSYYLFSHLLISLNDSNSFHFIFMSSVDGCIIYSRLSRSLKVSFKFSRPVKLAQCTINDDQVYAIVIGKHNIKKHMIIQVLMIRNMIEKFVNTSSKMICIFNQSHTLLLKMSQC